MLSINICMVTMVAPCSIRHYVTDSRQYGYCSLCIIHVHIRMCMVSLIADFGGIGSSGIRFSAPLTLTLGLDEMMHICRCALSGDELVFKPDFNDEMRCYTLICKPIATPSLVSNLVWMAISD